MRILIVEDEQHLAQGLSFNLEAEGYQVDCVESGEQALALLLPAREQGAVRAWFQHRRGKASLPLTGPVHFDLVVLDVMLPGKDGFQVAAELRQASSFVPILMLTARGTAEDVLHGFAAGADDYLPKPFDLAILLARIRGLLRRTAWAQHNRPSNPVAAPLLPEQTPASASPASVAPASADGGSTEDVYSFAGASVDFARLELRAQGRTIPLTLMEANLMRFLIHNEGRAVSRKNMLEQVWGVREDTDTRAIDNFVVRLRRYIEAEPAKPKHLLTVRGVGYKFIAQPGV